MTEKVNWVTGTVAARLLGIPHQQLIYKSLHEKTITRKLRRLTHVHTRPCWMYSVVDINKVLECGQPRTEIIDEEGRWVNAGKACALLGISYTQLNEWAKNSYIRTKRVCINNKKVNGYNSIDIAIIQFRKKQSTEPTFYEQELVVNQKVVITSQPLVDPQAIDTIQYLKRVIDGYEKGHMPRQDLIKVLKEILSSDSLSE
jgi:hypothetical protein